MADLRAERTRGYLREGLMSLLKETPIEGITVSAVAKRAGVSRNSFYNHYCDLFALAEDCYMQELTYFSGSFKRLRDYANRREACMELLDETAHLLSFFLENPNFARMYLDNLCISQYFAGCRRATENLLLDHIETEYGGPTLPYLTSMHCARYITWGANGQMRAWFYDVPRASVQTAAKELVYYQLQSTAGMAGHPIEPEYLRAINDWRMS